MSVSIGSAIKGENIVQILLWLLCQPGENTVMLAMSDRREVVMSTAMAAASARRECCYGCCVSQERGCVALDYTMATAKATASTRRE